MYYYKFLLNLFCISKNIYLIVYQIYLILAKDFPQIIVAKLTYALCEEFIE